MSNYVDVPSTIQVLGNIYNDQTLIDNENYPIQLSDFCDIFHKTIYSVFYELCHLINQRFGEVEILDFIENRPRIKGIFEQNNGLEFIREISNIASKESLDYYFNRFKKISLLRAYDDLGVDVKDLYDPTNVLDGIKKQSQENWLDNHSLQDMANIIEDRIIEIRQKHVDNTYTDIIELGSGAFDIIEKFKQNPEYGAPMYGKYMNALTRGMRIGEVYLTSAATGCGKSRTLVANTLMAGCDTYFDEKTMTWVDTNMALPSLYITTEQQYDEILTMALAFISGVPEWKILDGKCNEIEEERLKQAAEIMNNKDRCKVEIQVLPDFSIQDVETAIKRAIRKFDCRYVFFDYIHESIKLMSEINKSTGGSKLREDQLLFMLTDKLKNIAIMNQVFIMSSTQLNDSFRAGVLDQGALRGAKSIADRISYGQIMVYTTAKDLQAIQPIVDKIGCATPKILISVYKARRGKYQNVLLWCEDQRDVCRINPMFVTNKNYELIEDIEDINIIYNKESNGYSIC